MLILTFCCGMLALAYAALMLLYRLGWDRQKTFTAPDAFRPATSISVIIPARNEAANIAACVKSVVAQQYPENLLEIIVVDDHSEDDTAAIASGAGEGRVHVVSLKDILDGRPVNAYKKQALSAGIAASRGALIVTTDADCTASQTWLRNIAALFEEQQAVMIAGPVAFHDPTSISGRFQSLDFMMMQAITAAAHRLKLGGMANGANLAFSRKAFDEISGYEGTTHLASGDDYLLLHKMEQAFPGRIHYLKSREAIVHTAPQPGWRTFLQQRIRWASKSGRYADHRLTLILALVYLFNLSLAVLAIACIWQPRLLLAPAALLCLKVLAEGMLLWPAAGFFQKRRELLAFPLLQPLHILYIIAAGFLGMKGGYRWKGRRVH
jgi:cellulose synthase/poly-beta-1,6-N-acetylglucosamine synthase-like glycosyltransferase